MASADAAPKIAAFLYLEEVIALQRCSRQHARRFGAPGAALRSRVQPHGRARRSGPKRVGSRRTRSAR